MRRFRLRLCLALGKFQQAEKLWRIEACLCRVIVYKGIRRIEKQQLEHRHTIVLRKDGRNVRVRLRGIQKV